MPETVTCPQCGTPLPPNSSNTLCPKCMLQVGLGSQPNMSEGPSALPKPPAPADLAQYFPQLEIIELLGQGGMGIVYKARQTQLDRLVALKILPAEPARDPAFAERFTREARALARLNHPNIVTVYDFGQTGGIYFFLMEYVDGANLRQLEQSGTLKPQEALQLIPALCDALQYAHNIGIVHRDIKPENVLIDKQGRVKIADFGLAKLLGATSSQTHLTQERQVMGTMNYMAPEQLERPAEVDHRADIYSLGVVFYEMLTGELPLGRFAPPSQKVQVDVRLDEVVLRALEKERERRYQQASEVKTDLETIAAGVAGAKAGPTMDLGWLHAHQAVKGPGIGLIVVGILNWLVSPILFVIGAYFAAKLQVDVASASTRAQSAVPLLAAFVPVVAGAFMLFAGLKMKSLEARWAALTGSVLAMVVTPANLLGLPIGIWSLVTLTRQRVRRHFGKGLPPLSMRPPSAPAGSNSRNWFFATATVVLAVGAVIAFLMVGLTVVGLALPAISRIKAERAQAPEIQFHPRSGWRQRRALVDALSGAIVKQLEGQYNIERFDLTLAQSGKSATFSATAVTNEVQKAPDVQLDLHSQTDGSWVVKGRAPVEHIQFTIPPPPLPYR